MSEPCTGYVFDFATPAPKRATKRANAFTANPHANTITENTAVAQPMIGARRKRSASHPIGSAPSARKMNIETVDRVCDAVEEIVVRHRAHA